jgi:hypothetical protein
MSTIFEAREALDKAVAIVKELIMADQLVTDVERDYREFLDFWEEVYALDRLLDRYDRDASNVKRELIYDAMTEEGMHDD